MLELEIESIRVRQETQQRAVVLKVKGSDLYLPIFVGPFEVEAIRFKLMDIEVQRPMTHDLLGSVIVDLGATVESIVVSELRNDTFYAKIVMDFNGSVVEVDSRPSDAIALAVRANVPIFASENVIDKAAVTLPVNDADDVAKESDSNQQATVGEEELEKLSAFTDFIDGLDLGDIGKDQ